MLHAAKQFCEGWKQSSHECAHKKHIKQEKEMRDNLTDDQLDLRDSESGPASDPASTY